MGRSNNNFWIRIGFQFLTLFLFSLLIFGRLDTMASSSDCDVANSKHESRPGMPGGYSAPHEPTPEELFLFKKAYFEAKSKCSHLPEALEKVKVCSVSKQVVAGMNYAFTLEDQEGRTFKMVVYQPLPHMSSVGEKVTSCEMIGNGASAKSS